MRGVYDIYILYNIYIGIYKSRSISISMLNVSFCLSALVPGCSVLVVLWLWAGARRTHTHTTRVHSKKSSLIFNFKTVTVAVDSSYSRVNRNKRPVARPPELTRASSVPVRTVTSEIFDVFLYALPVDVAAAGIV